MDSNSNEQPVYIVKESDIPQMETFFPKSNCNERDKKCAEKSCRFISSFAENGKFFSAKKTGCAMSFYRSFNHGSDQEFYEKFGNNLDHDKIMEASDWLKKHDVRGSLSCKDISRETKDVFCQGCDFKDTVESPAQIEDYNFVTSKEIGFRELKQKKNGESYAGEPEYDELGRYFYCKYPHLTNFSSITYHYKDMKWTKLPDIVIENFIQKNLDPRPRNNHVAEFVRQIKREHVVHNEWFRDRSNGKINFKNCVYDIKTNTKERHSKNNGFQYILPYDYDPDAKCPALEKFISDVTVGDEQLRESLLMFLAAGLFQVPSVKVQKALFLLGSGGNGKSTFINIMQKIAGEENYTPYTMTDLKEDNKRVWLDGKIFNFADENDPDSLLKSDEFKTLVGGAKVSAKFLYKDTYVFENNAKIVVLCNRLPKTKDYTEGFFRRLLIVPFDFKVSDENKDTMLDEKLEAELSGIFNLLKDSYFKLKKLKWIIPVADRSMNVLENYRKDSDVILQFIDERCIVIEEREDLDRDADGVRIDRCFEEFANFCERNKVKTPSKTTFINRVVDSKFNVKKHRAKMPDGSRPYYFIGLKLRQTIPTFST